MRIWVIGRNMPTTANYMRGSFEFEQAQMLAKHGNEVYYPVLDMRFIHRTKRIGLETRFIGGVHVVILYLPFGHFIPQNKKRAVKYSSWKLLLQLLAKKHGMPDVIHVHYPTLYSYRVFEWIHQKGVKLVCTEHWSKVQEKTLSEFALANLRECVENYDAVMCVGALLREAILSLTDTDREIIVVPNIVSEDFFCCEMRKSREDNSFRFVCVGRLIESKCFDLLINAFADVFQGNAQFSLDIIGGGPEYGHLQEIIAERDCVSQIKLMGTMSRAEVASFYLQCDALVVSSRIETFCVPIIEAMASGMPVITTDVVGVKDFLREDHGYMIPPNDRAALAAAMERMYAEYDKFDSKTISDYARQHFSEDVVYEQLFQCYKR